MTTMDTRARILAAITAERERQDAKWGERNHDSVWEVVVRHLVRPVEEMAAHYGVPTAAAAKDACERAARGGHVAWADILVEEVAEAIEAAVLEQHDEVSAEDVDRQIVQVAAVCVSWLEARARRRAGGER